MRVSRFPMSPAPRRTLVRAFTLVELVAVMACMVVVAAIAMVFLFQMFSFQQRNDEYAAKRDRVSRLLEMFREDVHRYGKPEIFEPFEEPTPDRPLLQWRDGPTLVAYSWDDCDFPDQRRLRREVLRDGKRVAVEGYALPDKTVLSCVDGRDTHAGLVALGLWVPPADMPASALTPEDRKQIDPLTRTLPENLAREIDPAFAANWRTAVVRYAPTTP